MIQTASPVRNKHLVRELDRGRIRELLLVAGLTVLLLLPLLAYVWNHMEWIGSGYELERLKQERVAMSELRARLRIEKASLRSLARVEREAKGPLGMVPAAGSVILLQDPPAPAVAGTGGAVPRVAQRLDEARERGR